MRIYLSGVEVGLHTLEAAMLARPPNLLMSYFSRDRLGTKVDPVMYAAESRLVDSGAYSFLYGGAAGVDFDAYLAGYADWLVRRIRLGLTDWFIEMDIARLTSPAWVERQRRFMIARGLGPKMITVWHSEMSWSDWVYLLDEASRPGRSRYVAIEGRHGDRAEIDYGRFVAAAYARGVRVHGFMLTGREILESVPFYSVDSTSWATVAMYGTVHELGRYAVTTVQRSRTSKAPPVGTASRAYVKPLAESIRAWVEAGRRLTSMWEARGIDWEGAIRSAEAT